MSRAECTFTANTPSGSPVNGTIVIEFEHELDEEMTSAEVCDMAERVLDGDWQTLMVKASMGGAM